MLSKPSKKGLTIDYLNSNPKFKLYDVVDKVLIPDNGFKVNTSKLKIRVYFFKAGNFNPVTS